MSKTLSILPRLVIHGQRKALQQRGGVRLAIHLPYIFKVERAVMIHAEVDSIYMLNKLSHLAVEIVVSLCRSFAD